MALPLSLLLVLVAWSGSSPARSRPSPVAGNSDRIQIMPIPNYVRIKDSTEGRITWTPPYQYVRKATEPLKFSRAGKLI